MFNKNQAIAALVGLIVGLGAMALYNHYSTGSKEVTVAAGKTLTLTCEGFDNDIGQVVVPTNIPGIQEVSKAKFGCKVVDAATQQAKVAAK